MRDGVCMGPLLVCPPLLRARIKSIPQEPCAHKSHIYQLVDPIPGMPTCNVYQTCLYNELHSLVYRHLINNGIPSRNIAADMLGLLLSVFKPTAIEPLSRGMVVARKVDGPSRRRYGRAKDSLDRYGPSITWDKVSAFVKIEKWEQAQIEAKKPPRLIQFRTYPYCLEVSRYLIPIEDHIWKLEMNGLKVFAKSMSSFALGALFRKAYELFDKPYILMMDHSKFDASLSRELIEIVEHGLYSQFTSDLNFLTALKSQLRNKCYSKHGIRYACEGRKMSGEYNTSCGDSIVNLSIIMHAMETSGVRYHPLINGDDSVVICESNPNLTPDDFKRYGMKTEVLYGTEFSDIEFCQCKPIEVRPGVWRMVRNPTRVMSRGVVSVKRYNGIGWAKLVHSIGLSELACNDGIPVLQEFALYMIRAAKKYTNQHIASEISYRARLERQKVEPTPISDCARVSFADTFGLSPTDQLSIEESLRRHTSDVYPMSKLG